jgi:hypothetical protein
MMRRYLTTVFASAFCTILPLCGRPARAAFVFTLVQVATNIQVTGSGTFNTSALNFRGDFNGVNPNLEAGSGLLIDGPPDSNAWLYSGISGPVDFGPGAPPTGPSGAGDIVGMSGGIYLYLPANYVSGTYLSDYGVIQSVTYSGIGATPGSYVYTWGAGATADSLTLNIGVNVPEPASLAMLGGPAAIALLRRRVRTWL